MGCLTTGTVCRSRWHTNDSEFVHKPYSSTWYILLELHQKWSIYNQLWILVSTNLMTADEAIEVLQPTLTKLQAFGWKVNAPQKICHFIWQLILGHVAVTRNLICRNMQCDSYCQRCGEPEETVTHAIFKCPPALQAWALSSTLSSSQTFPISSIYANMDYLFWRKSSIMKPEDDRETLILG